MGSPGGAPVKQRETKEDKGRQRRMSLASSANLTRSKDTATAGVSSATTSFPEMASSAPNDDAMLALQIANFENACAIETGKYNFFKFSGEIPLNVGSISEKTILQKHLNTFS